MVVGLAERNMQPLFSCPTQRSQRCGYVAHSPRRPLGSTRKVVGASVRSTSQDSAGSIARILRAPLSRLPSLLESFEEESNEEETEKERNLSSSASSAAAAVGSPTDPLLEVPQNRQRMGNPFSLLKFERKESAPAIAVAGGGIFFFWEIGALKYMSENFDLGRAVFSGASAGALASVLLACGVDLDAAVRKAYQISLDNDVWSRSGGLIGIWGGLIRKWLEDLLPDDAAERCNGRVRIIVTEAPSLRLRCISEFSTKGDVVNACMASVHVPFFLDGSPTFAVRGRHYLDGSLYDFLTGGNSRLLSSDGKAQIVDYFMDDQLQFSRLDFLKLTDYEEVKKLVRAGYEWAQRIDAAGGFDEKLGGIRKSLARRALELPAREFHRAFYAVA